MLVFLYGKEEYLAYKRYRELQDAFISKNPSAPLDFFDLEDDDFSQVAERLRQGAGLFSSKRFIVLKNPFSLSPSQQIELQSNLSAAVGADGEMTIVLVEKELKDKKSSLLKFLLKSSNANEYKKLDKIKLKSWIIEELKNVSEGKVELDSQAAGRIIELTKGNLWKIAKELEKLVTYKEQGRITISDIELLCQGEVETKIFDLVDAIGQRNKKKAHQLIQTMLRQDENAFYIFTMIVFQLRNLAKVADLARKGIIEHQTIARQLNLHPFTVGKTMGSLRNFPYQALKGLYSLAADIDYQVKTGKRDMEEALSYFVAKS